MDRLKVDPKETLYNPNDAGTGDMWSEMQHMRAILESADGFVVDVQQRLCVMWGYAMSLYAGMRIRDTDIANIEFPRKYFNLYDAADWLYTGSFTTGEQLCIAQVHKSLGKGIQGDSDRVAAFASLMASGSVATFGNAIPAYMALYAALVVSACAAQRARRKNDANGYLILFTYDIYAALIWVCHTLRALVLSGADADPLTISGAMSYLRDELDNSDVFKLPNETYHPVWSNLSYIEYPGSGIQRGLTLLDTIKLPTDGPTQATFAWSSTDEACAAEALFYEYMRHTVSDWAPVLASTTYPNGLMLTRVAYVPNTDIDDIRLVPLDAIWTVTISTKNYNTLTTITGMLIADLDDFCNGPSRPTKDDCDAMVRAGKAVYWDGSRCLAIPDCSLAGKIWDAASKSCVDCPPGTKWDPVKKACATDTPTCPPGFHWDVSKGACVPDTPSPDPEKADCDKRAASGEDVYWDGKACVPLTPEMLCNKRKAAGEDVEWDGTSCIKKPTPPSGGGGGGGGGGSGPALFIGILALLALFGRR